MGQHGKEDYEGPVWAAGVILVTFAVCLVGVMVAVLGWLP